MGDLLTTEDLEYMRATQAEARPTTAGLRRAVVGRTPTGGSTTTWAAAESVTVRLDGSPDEVPQVVADRLEGGTAVQVSMDLALDVRSGDRLEVTPTEVYQFVSDGNPDRWATAQVVWAKRVKFPARTA